LTAIALEEGVPPQREARGKVIRHQAMGPRSAATMLKMPFSVGADEAVF